MGKTARTLFVVFGCLIWLFSVDGATMFIVLGLELPVWNLVLLFIGLGLSLYGCYLWARLKGRHWSFMFLGIITPIGLLPLALLKSK